MKRTMYTVASHTKFFLTLLSLVFATGVLAQPTATLSVQGVLTRSDGTAVDDGTYSVSFKLFDAQTGGNQVHSESIDVETIGGVYSVILGAGSTPLTAQFNTIYYLSVTVGSSELTPRPRLTHAPYALSLIGQNNTFPSTGAVTADAMVVPGGAPNAPVAGKGYSFGAGGDTDGGLFSLGDNNVALYANATKALEANNSGVSIPGTLSVTGNTTLSGNATVSASLTSGAQTVNGNETVNGNITVTGTSQTNGKVITNFEGAGGGYSFIGDGAFDTGLFGKFDGECALKANGTDRILIGANGVNYITGPTVISLNTGHLTLNGVKPKGTTGNPRNIAIDLDNGRIFEESSSRRYKTNIRNLQDNFSLLLQVQPRIYNRYEDPVDIDTAKYFELGYIAEEIDSIGLHKLVQFNNEGQIDGVDYTKMILYAVEVLKMQDAAIKELQAELAVLKAENAQLETNNITIRAESQALQTTLSAQLEQLSQRMNALEIHKGGPNRK